MNNLPLRVPEVNFDPIQKVIVKSFLLAKMSESLSIATASSRGRKFPVLLRKTGRAVPTDVLGWHFSGSANCSVVTDDSQNDRILKHNHFV